MRRVLPFLLLLSSVASAQPAKPDPAKLNEAKGHFQQGRALVDAKAYDEGIAEYEAGYAIVPMPEFIFNIAQAHRLKGDKAKAVDAFRRYVLMAPDGAGAAEASQHIAALTVQIKAELATLVVVVEPSLARVTIDGAPATAVGKGRYQATLSPGQHRVVATSSQGESVQSVTLGVAEQREVSMKVAAPGRTEVTRMASRGRLGVLIRGDADPLHGGVALVAGATLRVATPVDLVAGVLLGPPLGAYVGGRYRIGHGRLRPAIVVGVPLVFREGVAPGGHLGAALEFDLSPRFTVSLEAGGEYYVNMPDGVADALLLVSLGVQARL